MMDPPKGAAPPPPWIWAKWAVLWVGAGDPSSIAVQRTAPDLRGLKQDLLVISPCAEG